MMDADCNAGSAHSVSVSKSASTKSTPATGGTRAQPVTDQASARGDASTEDAAAAQQKRVEVVPTQQQHTQQKVPPVSQMRVSSAPQQQPMIPEMNPMGSSGMLQPNGMLSYGLHVRCPLPLPLFGALHSSR
jgi:hypothetical protein